MRILFWSELFCPYIGGAEVWAMSFLRRLRQRGHEITVITSHDGIKLPDETSYDGIAVYRFPFRKILRTGDVQKARVTRQQVAALKRIVKPDLIHVNAVSASVLFHLQTVDADRGAPWVTRINQEILSPDGTAPNTLMRRVLSTADWITCVSAMLLGEVRKRAPEIIPRSSVIYSGLAVSGDGSDALDPNPAALLCLGRLVPAKGFDLALEAFSAAIRRFPCLRLIIAGDGPARPELERRTVKLGLSESVDFVGWVGPDSVTNLLRTASVVLIPSRREGLPVVAIQAALAGKPIIAARVSGLPEAVIPGETGLLIEKEDSQALANAICYLFERPETIARMGQTGRRRARELFSEEKCVDAYDALYRQLRGGNAHATTSINT